MSDRDGYRKDTTKFCCEQCRMMEPTCDVCKDRNATITRLEKALNSSGVTVDKWRIRAEAAEAENARLTRELEEAKKQHCKDCCCAQSWKALGITEYTGKSIPEHIEEIRAENAALKEKVERVREWEKMVMDYQDADSWIEIDREDWDTLRIILKRGEP